jgi:hypothetical protein
VLRRLGLGRSGRQQLIANLRQPTYQPDPKSLIKYIEDLDKNEGVSYRVHYNLACYWTGCAARPGDPATAMDTALAELAKGVELGNLTNWVHKDPSLAWWTGDKQDEKIRARFERVLASVAAEVDEGPLSEGDPVGRWAAKLGAAGVHSEDDLVLRTRSDTDRQTLARQLQVSPELIASWYDYATLLELRKIDVPYANLLSRAGVRSRASLAIQQAEPLRARLVEANTGHHAVESVPERGELEDWIREARDLAWSPQHHDTYGSSEVE